MRHESLQSCALHAVLVEPKLVVFNLKRFIILTESGLCVFFWFIFKLHSIATNGTIRN